MFVVAEILNSLALLVTLVVNVIYVLLVIRIVLSWVGADPYNEIIHVIYSVTDVILWPFRWIPLQVGMIDFTPIVAFIFLSVAKSFVVNILYRLAARIG